MNEVISFENVTISFENKILFEDLNFSINQGDKLLIKGPSGRGKTTILYTILGFIQPLKGTVKIKGKRLTEKRILKFRKYFSYVPQNPDVLRGNVLEAIEEIFSSKINNSTNFSTQKLKELMSYFNLQDSTLTKDFSELSGGEKQRIAIIISILLDRETFLLDEPTASLDEELKEKTVDFFSKQKNKTQLVISHDPQWEKLENVKIMEV